MLRYFFVNRQNPFTDNLLQGYFPKIINLSQQGNSVSIFLLLDGVTLAIKTAQRSCFDELLTKPITIYADAHSLAQRGIITSELKPNIQTTELNTIIHATLNGDEVIWV
ncbi:DsrE family protein [Cellvibrio mixtus]|uniref:DsrE family protein n=1 Tax=Cellvibrio mixtus TaxID=39650 RepID=UPI0005877479|nr:DsrE family protein [Cellvibrio mixtus]